MGYEDDEVVARPTALFPPADISAAEFEVYVAELLGSANALVDDLKVALHEVIVGGDGDYDFDATIRFKLAGMAFLVLVECKKHKNPIKRELVQVLHQKMQSVGAQKGAMFSTAPYQSGALKFALKHGIALVRVTEGRFTFETRSVDSPPTMTREEALERFGLPAFVGQVFSQGSQSDWLSVTTLSPECPEDVAEQILGVNQSR
jgi:hypothetical protein